MRPRHIAVVSGLALTLALGAAQVTTPAFADADATAQQGSDDAAGASAGSASGAAGTAGDPAAGEASAAADAEADGADGESDATSTPSEQLPAPSDYDKSDFYEDAASVSLLSARSSTSSSLTSVSVSSEMKYFTKYESHSNYRQGFGSGDGYNALGYYQFDRRYSLIPFLTAVYNTNPSKYSMLKEVVSRGSEVKKASSMYDSKTKSLTALGKLVQDAWYAAYDKDPAEFSAFQDAYAYNSYYVPTEKWLKSELGIDMSGRADCVKGMVWGLSNMWGTGGVRNVLRGAKLSNSMSDLEFVTALSKQMTDNIAQYSSQTIYYKGWKNRYKNELSDCKAFLALSAADDEAGDGASDAAAGNNGGSVADEGVNDGASAGADSSGSSSADGAEDDASNDAADDQGSAGNAADEGDADQVPASDADDTGDDGADDAEDDGAGDAPAADLGSNDASDGTGDVGGSDTTGDAQTDTTSPSKPSPAPITPSEGDGNSASSGSSAGNAGSSSSDAGKEDGSDEGTGSNGAVSDGSSSSQDEGSDDSSNKGDDTTSKGDSKDDSSNDDAGDDDKSDDKQDDDEGDPKGPAALTDDGSDGGTKGTKTGDPADDATKGNDNGGAADKDSQNGAARMPQTSDLIMFTGFAGASAATFGATFIAAGKAGLRKRKHRD